MANEINTNNVVAMLKETASFCRDTKQVFEDICTEIGEENLIIDVVAKSFFFDKNGWLCYDFYFESNHKVNGFRMLIATEATDGYERYSKITEKLSIDENIPLLLVYGCFQPVQRHFENIEYIMDACCGFTSKDDEEYDWANFDEKNIDWNTNILIETKEWTPEVGTSKDYPNWDEYFSKANIRYKPLLELRNRADVENFANEIKAMTI